MLIGLTSESLVPKRLCKGTLLREAGHSESCVSHSRLSADNMEVRVMQRAEEKPGMVQERTGERLNQGVCGRRVALVRVGN